MYIVIVYYTGNYILITINMSSLWIWQSEDRASWYILIIKNQRVALISQIYFWNRTLYVSDRFSVHHQDSSTVHAARDICLTGYADYWRNFLIPLATVSITINKFEKLVQIVGFIIRTYHVARSSECQISSPHTRCSHTHSCASYKPSLHI